MVTQGLILLTLVLTGYKAAGLQELQRIHLLIGSSPGGEGNYTCDTDGAKVLFRPFPVFSDKFHLKDRENCSVTFKRLDDVYLMTLNFDGDCGVKATSVNNIEGKLFEVVIRYNPNRTLLDDIILQVFCPDDATVEETFNVTITSRKYDKFLKPGTSYRRIVDISRALSIGEKFSIIFTLKKETYNFMKIMKVTVYVYGRNLSADLVSDGCLTVVGRVTISSFDNKSPSEDYSQLSLVIEQFTIHDRDISPFMTSADVKYCETDSGDCLREKCDISRPPFDYQLADTSKMEPTPTTVPIPVRRRRSTGDKIHSSNMVVHVRAFPNKKHWQLIKFQDQSTTTLRPLHVITNGTNNNNE